MSFIPTNLNSFSQAKYFGAGWGSNAFSPNSRRTLGAFGASFGLATAGSVFTD
jgi:hypothetical protein